VVGEARSIVRVVAILHERTCDTHRQMGEGSRRRTSVRDNLLDLRDSSRERSGRPPFRFFLVSPRWTRLSVPNVRS
jgi:hypothetical protein